MAFATDQEQSLHGLFGEYRRCHKCHSGQVQPSRGPEPGDPLLIDPRREDPLDLMQLDLLDTFQFAEMFPLGTREQRRASYTIQLLRLNDRVVLLELREVAYYAYRSLLRDFIKRREAGQQQRELDPSSGRFAVTCMLRSGTR